MPSVQFSAQALHQLPLVGSQNPSHHLGGEYFALHAGHSHRSPQRLSQTTDTLRNHRLHPSRQGLPVQRWSLDQLTTLVLHQIPPFLHASKKFNGKERLTAGLPVEHLSEWNPQPVRLAVQNGIHKITALSLIHVYHDVAKLALELVGNGLERMACPIPAQCDFFRAVSAHYQNPTTRQVPTQVEEQADRASIRPLQVVHNQHQWCLASQGTQHPSVLFKKVALLRACVNTVSCFAFHKFTQAGQPVRPTRRTGHSTLDQGSTRDEGVDQVRAGFHQRLGSDRKGIPQTPGVISGNGSCRPAGFHVTGQQFQNLAEGQVRVADAGVGVAVPAGDNQVSMGILGALGEFLNKGGFAAAGFAGDEYHPPLVGKSQVEKALQFSQFTLTGDKDGLFNLLRFSFIKEGWSSVCKVSEDLRR